MHNIKKETVEKKVAFFMNTQRSSSSKVSQSIVNQCRHL